MCPPFCSPVPADYPKSQAWSVQGEWFFVILSLVACLVVASGVAAGSEAPGAPCPDFTILTGAEAPVAARGVGRNLAPVAADLDGDGLAELYVGAYGKRMVALVPTESGSFFSAGAVNPLDAVTMSYESDTPCVALADIDGDGDNDAVWFDFRPVGSRISPVYLNQLVFLKNEGSPQLPDFQMVPDEENPFAGVLAEWQGTPAFGDFDADGDLDLLFGDRSGTFRYCRNLLTEEGFLVYAEMMGSLNPFAGIDVGDNSSPALLDVDGDGDLDVVSGEIHGGLRWIENTTSPGGPLAFALRAKDASPFASLSTGVASMPAVLDFDGDTDPDLVVGSSDGRLTFLANQRLEPPETLTASQRDDATLSQKSGAPLQGDLNGDESVDLADAVFALKTLAGTFVNALGARDAEGNRG